MKWCRSNGWRPLWKFSGIYLTCNSLFVIRANWFPPYFSIYIRHIWGSSSSSFTDPWVLQESQALNSSSIPKDPAKMVIEAKGIKWPRIKVKARKPSPPQKPRMSPRSRMTQGKQRPKTFLTFNQLRKKSLLLQPRPKAGVDRIRFLVRQNFDLTWQHISCVRNCEDGPRLIKQINKNMDRQVSCFSALIAEHLVVRRRRVY